MNITRPLTAPENPGFSLANQYYLNAGYSLLKMSADKVTTFARNGNTLVFSTDVHTGDALTAPTWTNSISPPVVNNSALSGFIELPSGEALLVTTETSNPSGTNLSHFYRTTGWDFGAGKLTATLDWVHSTVGGTAVQHYCLHDSAYGRDGNMVLSEQGPQTTGGVGNQAADIRKARRVWNYNYLTNVVTLIFDIYEYGAVKGFPYPATVHIHGVAYDEDWKRYWVCWGDGNGQGKNIAGEGFTMTSYMDDLRAWDGSGTGWKELPCQYKWENSYSLSATQQWIVPVIFATSIVFTPDTVMPLSPWVYSKVGYRELGEPHAAGIAYRGTPSQGGGLNGLVHRADKDAKTPVFLTGQEAGATGGSVYIPILTDDGFTQYRIREVIPAQTPALSSVGYTAIFGPYSNGRIVGMATHYINNDNTKRTMVADLVENRTETGGTASVQNGSTIAHGLPRAPSKPFVQATVANRAVAVTSVDDTNITISLTTLSNVAVTVNENVRWTAEL